jgi:hypothetical protein
VPLRVRRIAVLLVAGVALHPACDASTELHASDFDQSCVVDSDCTGVFDGEVCPCGPSHPAAIASRAEDAFRERQNAMAGNCSQGCFTTKACGFAWGAPSAYCANGTCTVCVECPDAGNVEPDSGFVVGDAQACPPPAYVIPGAPCAITGYATPACAGEVAACDGGIEATTCVCRSDAAPWVWTCTRPAPVCDDAGAKDAALDAALDSGAGD